MEKQPATVAALMCQSGQVRAHIPCPVTTAARQVSHAGCGLLRKDAYIRSRAFIMQ